MAITFKENAPTRHTIDKDGTLFHFEINAAKRKRARIQQALTKEGNVAEMMLDLFRTALVDWNNLLDEDGKEIPFSIAVRDGLIENTDVFDENDVFDVVTNAWTPEAKDAAAKKQPAKGSTRGRPRSPKSKKPKK